MKTLQEDLKSKNFKHVYLLCGEEDYLVGQYERKLRDALSEEGDTMNFARFSGNDTRPGELIDLSETLPFFSDHRLILVENSGFFKQCPDILAEYMESIPDTTYFVFAWEDVDKRNKLYKQVKKYGSVIEFKRQNDAVLMQWVLGRLKREDKKITRSVMELFLSRTGQDMETIDRELEKLLCYTMDKEVIEAEDVEAVCANQISGKIFDMVDAIAGKDQKRALDLYYDLLMLKEPSMRILFLIARQFHILLQLKAMADQGFDYKYMSGKAGIPEFAVRKYIGQSRKFQFGQLKTALEDALRAETDIKTGQIEDRLAVELLIVKYSRSAHEHF